MVHDYKCNFEPCQLLANKKSSLKKCIILGSAQNEYPASPEESHSKSFIVSQGALVNSSNNSSNNSPNNSPNNSLFDLQYNLPIKVQINTLIKQIITSLINSLVHYFVTEYVGELIPK